MGPNSTTMRAPSSNPTVDVRPPSLALSGVALRASALILGLIAFERGAAAQDKPTLSGSWTASGMSERWAIGDWGDACGPKPAGKGAGGGSITINDSGSDLSFSGGGYPSTRGCFEMGGGIGLVSHSGGARFWRSVCSTSANDPRKARIVTTLQATDTTISFDETGEYQFILKEQNCTASVRRNRTYTLVKRAGEETAPSATASAAPVVSAAPSATTAVATTTAASGSCASPGEPSKLEVRPAKKAMRPGESFSFRATVLDDASCVVSIAPQWSVREGTTGVSVSPQGVVTVAEGTADGEVPINVGVKGKTLSVIVEVVSADRYASLLASSGLNASGESNEAATTVIATGGLGGGATEAQTAAQTRRRIFFGVAGSGAVALGALGLFLWRRNKRQAPEVLETVELVPVEPTTTVVQKKRVVARPKAGPPSVAQPPMPVAPAEIPAGTDFGCSRCGWRTSAGPGFCPNDGTPLLAVVPLASGPAPARAPADSSGGAPVSIAGGAMSFPMSATMAKKICPVCGTTYGAEHVVCASDGASLVPLNVR